MTGLRVPSIIEVFDKNKIYIKYFGDVQRSKRIDLITEGLVSALYDIFHISSLNVGPSLMILSHRVATDDVSIIQASSTEAM